MCWVRGGCRAATTYGRLHCFCRPWDGLNTSTLAPFSRSSTPFGAFALLSSVLRAALLPARFLSRALQRFGSVESPESSRRYVRVPSARSPRMPSFEQLGSSAAVVEVLAARGIATAFPVQQLVVPDVLAGRDALVMSPTGSGKTLAFAAPIVDLLEASD